MGGLAKIKKDIFGIILAAAVGYVIIKYLFFPLLPFVLAGIISFAAVRAAGLFRFKKRIAASAAASALALAFYLMICFITVTAGRLVYYQLADFCTEAMKNSDKILKVINKISDLPGSLSEFIFPDGAEKLSSAISSAVKSAADGILSKLPALLGRMASAVPKILLFSFVTVAATFYICADSGKIREKLGELPLWNEIKTVASGFIGKAAGAYGALFLLTFAQLFFGFSVIGIRYSFLIAAAASLIDVLPVLGVGAVLVPWSAASFMLGNGNTALFLLILWLSVVLVRQIAEPRLVGDGLGIPPVVSLASMYAGLMLFGARGLLIAPLAAAVTVAAIRHRKGVKYEIA